ncbi:MAG: hypothetical protein Ta2F_10470 [Termitinemataceae bacterium]|nr:MAG: hypothetical protein Ta2F_10470 [Termitinemataceae bacterium]
MIKIKACVDVDGMLKSCNVTGHANAACIGKDIVCAAVSVLVRSAELTLRGKEGIHLQVSAARRGEFFLEVSLAKENAENSFFLKAVGDFLLNGLASVAQEFPKNCSLIVNDILVENNLEGE